MSALNKTIAAHSAAIARPEHIAPLDARRRTEPREKRQTTMEECMGCERYIEVGPGEEAWCPACWREYQRFLKARGK